MPDPQMSRIRRLERTVGELRERVRQLEEVLAPQIDLPAAWGLTPGQTRMFRALLAREMVTKEQGRHASSLSSDELCSDNHLKVHVCSLRSKLRRHGVEIETVRGSGYRLASRLSWRAKLGYRNAGPGISPPEPASH